MRWHNFTKNVCLCLPTHLTSCWMSNIWNSIWTFVKSDTSFFFFSVKALLNLILEWKKGRKFTILCQGHGELKIYRQTARKCSIWVSIELFLKNNFPGNTRNYVFITEIWQTFDAIIDDPYLTYGSVKAKCTK